MVKTTTLAIILAALIISVVFADEADAAGLVKRAISTVGTWAVSDIPQLPATKISLTDGNIIVGDGSGIGSSVNPTGDVDISNTGVFSISNIHSIGNVTSVGCAVGQILKVSGTTWGCAADSTGSGISSINGDTTAAQTIVGVTGNTTASTTSGATTINLGTNVVMTGGSAQTVTKALTINSGTLTNPQINGLDLAITSQSGSYTATSTDDVILMDASAASRILTLPAAASNSGKIFYVKSIGTPGVNVVMVDGNGAETIDGFANFNMTMTGGVSIVQSDGTNWQRLDDVAAIPLVAGTTINRWHGTAITSLASSTSIAVVTTLRAYPFIVNDDITIDQIKTEISTAGNPTGTLCRIGIYRDNGNTYPQSLVTGSDVGTFDSTAAVKTNTFASPIKLNKGLYWFAEACATAATTQPTFRGVPVGAIPSVLGYTSTMTATQAGTGWSVAFTFAAFPTSYPSGGTVIIAGVAPMILVRITG